MPVGISKRERCTTSSPPASACSDPTCAWGQKQRFVLLPSILHKCKALCGTCAAGIAAPKALHESKGPFSFAKENGPFGTPRERLRLAVLGLNDLGTSGMRMPARGGAALELLYDLVYFYYPLLRSRWRLCRLTDAAHPLRVPLSNLVSVRCNRLLSKVRISRQAPAMPPRHAKAKLIKS